MHFSGRQGLSAEKQATLSVLLESYVAPPIFSLHFLFSHFPLSSHWVLLESYAAPPIFSITFHFLISISLVSSQFTQSSTRAQCCNPHFVSSLWVARWCPPAFAFIIFFALIRAFQSRPSHFIILSEPFSPFTFSPLGYNAFSLYLGRCWRNHNLCIFASNFSVLSRLRQELSAENPKKQENKRNKNVNYSKFWYGRTYPG